MSNLYNKVNNQSPTVDGEITLSTSNISDFNITSPANNEAIQYNGSSWINGGIPSVLFDFVSLWRTNGVTQTTQANYNTSFEQPFYLTARWKYGSAYLMERQNTTVAGISADSYRINSNAIFSTGFLVDRATSKKALLICDLVIPENSTSTGYIDVQWQSETGTALGPIVRVHRQDSYNRNTVYGYIDTEGLTTDSDATVGLKRLAMSGTLGYATSTETRANIIMFAKLVQ